MRNIVTVAKREYIKIVRKKSFWISTFLFPAFIALVSFVSGYSAQQAEQKILEEAKNVDSILIYDPGNIINPAFLITPYERIDNKAVGIERVQAGTTDGLFVYPEDIYQSKQIDVYAPDTGIMSRGRFTNIAQELLHQSILIQLPNPELLQLVQTQPTVSTIIYEGNTLVTLKIEDFFVPILTLILYFLMTFLASNFLLMSVSEEKETRMIEIMLSILRSSELITGKIIGLFGIAVTQIAVLGGFSLIALPQLLDRLPVSIDLSAIPLDPIQIGISLFYLLSGFLFISAIMVGVGAAMPSYREAQSFSSIFIMLSIFPMYFAAVLIQDPSGLIATILSYTPFTAPLILLTRLALNALPPIEMAISSVVVLLYLIVGFWIAFKLFELGSLEFNNKLSFKKIFSAVKK